MWEIISLKIKETYKYVFQLIKKWLFQQKIKNEHFIIKTYQKILLNF